MFATLWKGDVHRTYDNPPVTVGSYVWAMDFDGPQLFKLCYAVVAVDFGEVLRDAAVIVGGGTPTTQSDAGTNSLHDTGAFTDAEALLVGAFGKTLGTTLQGGGQGFFVKSKVDDDELKIVCTSTQVGISPNQVHQKVDDGNWAVAVTTGGTYTLWKSGRVRLASAGLPVIGVCQVRGTTEPMVAAAKYFFAKCSGLAECIGDTSDSAILNQQLVTVGTVDGTVEGLDASGIPLVEDLAGYVGIAQHGDISTDDSLVSVMLDIPIGYSSQHHPRFSHPLNAGTI